MPGCGGCSVRCCRMPCPCWTGGTSPCGSNTRCRPPAASVRARPTLASSQGRSAPSNGRSGACGTAAGRGVGASWWICSAGRSAGRCVIWLASAASTGHVTELLGYLERNQDALVHYAARRRREEPISTAFVESAVNEIVAKRMNKAQQMRWSKATVQPFLDVRAAVLNGTLEDAFRQRYPGFRPANDDQPLPKAA